MSNLYLVFDIETIGLYGEGFAAGAVVVDKQLREYSSLYLACHSVCAVVTVADREWIEQNVNPHLPAPNKFTPREVRNEFWEHLQYWLSKDATVWTDCCYPAETNFLTQCIRDDEENSKWQAPYPLLDLSTLLFARGLDPKATYPRQPNELPAHNPLADARQSARLLIENL